MPHVEFYCQNTQLPGMNLGEALVEYRDNAIPYPGEKIRYDLLTMSFIVDERMDNYVEIYKWIKELSVEQPVDPTVAKAAGIKDKCDNRGFVSTPLQRPSITDRFDNAANSSAELLILDTNFNTVKTFVFYDIFPIGLTSLNYTTQGQSINYITCTADFAYIKYYIKEIGI
jgi:hypothetical protein